MGLYHVERLRSDIEAERFANTRRLSVHAACSVPAREVALASCMRAAAGFCAFPSRFAVGAAAAEQGPRVVVQLNAVSAPRIVRPSS